MKILLAYDGSKSADSAIHDLLKAGLPDDSDAHVVSVGDLLMSSPSAQDIINASLISQRVAASLKRAQTHAAKVIEEAEQFASKAASALHRQFSGWNITSEVLTGTPAWELIDAADRWGADLIVVGSQGRSAISRLFLGSVSKRIATDASCSVRVARDSSNPADQPPRIVIGVDGSLAAEQAIHSVGQRVWKDGTEVKLVAVDDGTPPTARISTLLPQAADILASYYLKKDGRVNAMLDWAESELGHIGLRTSVVKIKGEPGKLVIEEARKWNADCIFVGTRDFANSFERFRLGSVSTAVVTHAHCTVEIVRNPAENPRSDTST